MMAYFALMLGTVKTYDKDAGMGTLMSLLLPYTLFYALVWVGVFVIWFSLGMPLGPGGALYM
jgi:aminobenzoyl-glutamate transport protein